MLVMYWLDIYIYIIYMCVCDVSHVLAGYIYILYICVCDVSHVLDTQPFHAFTFF